MQYMNWNCEESETFIVIHTLYSSAISNGEGITEQNNINMKVVLVVSCEFVQTHLSSFVNSLFTRELS